MSVRSLSTLLLLIVLLAGCGAAGPNGRQAATSHPTAHATAAPRATAAMVSAPAGFRGGTVSSSQLPAEALATLQLIEAGGPYRYDQDGSVFSNREGLLPSRVSGYYHEYTVETPGSADRGARRLVVGGAGERYYTDDHYDSFRFVVDP